MTFISRFRRPGAVARPGLVVAVVGAALITSGLGSGIAGNVTAHAAPVTYYFHGTATDDANRQQVLCCGAQPTATFDTNAPTNTSALGFTQTGTPPANKDDAGNALAVYWYAPFTGVVSGGLNFDWWWSSTNPTAIAMGAPMTVTVFADPTLENAGQPEIAQGTVTLNVSPTPTENHDTLAVKNTCPCTVNQHLLVQVSTTAADTGHAITAHYDSTAVASQFTVNAAAPTPTAVPTPTPIQTPGPGQTGPQLFHNYPAPYPYPHEPPPPSAVALLFGEPSIGVDWGTNNTMYQGDLNTWQVHFDYSVKPPVATWNDRSDSATAKSSLDARLITDHAGRSNDRTFVEQLHLAQSIQAYSDTDGGTAPPPPPPPGNSADWISGPAGGLVGGVDHESIAAGRYATGVALPTGAQTVYPHALYYCSQTTQSATGAFCARSDDGGATYGTGVQMYTTECGGLHGKPRVGPDGVVYVPNKNCTGLGGANAAKGVIISHDNGAHWTVVNIPNTTTDGNQPDSDLAVGGVTGMGTVYYAYRDGDHHPKVVLSSDDGHSWSKPTDLGTFFNIENAQFPEVIAGDQNRAAITFIGTTTKSTSTGGQGDAGDDVSDNFGCPKGQSTGCGALWYLYTAFTYDGGNTWQVVNATPNDPVQRGGVCMAGTGCSGSDRNMLDFNDETIDNQGRVQIAYTDGCTGACENDPTAAACSVGNQNCMGKFSSVFSMVNQTCGIGLIAKYDPGFNNDPACTSALVTPEGPVSNLLVLSGGAAAILVALVGVRRRRRGELHLPG